MRTLKQLALASVLILACPLSVSVPTLKSAPVARPSAQLTGIWSGEYVYPPGNGQEPVKFQMVLIQEGATVAGFIKEPNTFGQRKEPWLHATFKGRNDEKAALLTFTKTYDGTAGPSHDVEYSGTVGRDGASVEGKWSLGELSGTFTLQKLRLDERALESLK